jgi:hypothetical protein
MAKKIKVQLLGDVDKGGIFAWIEMVHENAKLV